jgi:hypothetical protein
MLMVCSFIHVSNAADLSQNLTESNVRETDRATWLPELRLGDESAYILFYGQINKGVLFYDDGRSSQTYGLVDNDSSSTRFGVRRPGGAKRHQSANRHVSRRSLL